MTSVDVVIITYERPENVKLNLLALAAQAVAPRAAIVVDASLSSTTKSVVASFPEVVYVANDGGRGNMTNSRNVALAHVSADVLAFLDDDAYPDPGYVQAVADFYDNHPDVDLSCSRTLNGVEGEEAEGLGQIGSLGPRNQLLGNFAADPGRDLPIHHGIGATMTMRRSLIQELGGFRELYSGVSGVREDADLYLRAGALGRQAWFVHKAVALHVAAPQSKGRRFDARYVHWAYRNTAMLAIANFGLFSKGFVWATLDSAAQEMQTDRHVLRRLHRTLVAVVGHLRGTVLALCVCGTGPLPPIGGYARPAQSRTNWL